MNKFLHLFIVFFLVSPFLFGQQNATKITANLHAEKDEINIQQELIFYNTSDSILNKIYLHNWANAYRDRKTPLSKRFIENYRKDLYFAKEKDLGHSKIHNLSVNFENALYKEVENHSDIIEIDLKTPLKPNTKVTISATYTLKIPNARFTNYGKTKKGYHLRNWYLTPAIYNKGWQLMSNLNLDDLYEAATDFNIEINIPKEYVLETNLYRYENQKEGFKNYYLVGKSKTDVILGINKEPQIKTYTTKTVTIHTDIFSKKLNFNLTTNILNRELLFLQEYLGKYPHVEIYIDKASQRKSPIYGLNQLPKFLSPFSNTFEWDITMFKALTKRYIENTLLLNKRKDYWLIDGIQNYLMIEYVEKFYPEVKLLGNISNLWFLKSFNATKLQFNDKYPFFYQFTARKFLDQALKTPSDSLSNFNRKIVNKYKAGLGFRYLKGYIGDSVLNETIQEFYQKNQLKIVSSKDFKKLLTGKSPKNLDWFFNEFIKTNKKIDHTITSIKKEKDSLAVTIKNKRNITSPVAIYGFKDKNIVLKKWITNVDTTKVVKFEKGAFDTFVLNYENLYPELNTLDNWEKVNRKIFNKPVKLCFYEDISDPNYNQLFYQPDFNYNFYNGLILGVKLHNKPVIKRNLEFKISPYYATKSRSLVGNFSVRYRQFFEKTRIHNTTYGIAGGTSDFAPNLSFKSLIPFASINFKRKSLRDATSESLSAKLVHIDKDVPLGEVKSEKDNYSVLSIRYNYVNPNIIKEFRYNFSTEFAKNFSKAALDLRYRSLSSSDTQLDFRLYAGTFLRNNTRGNDFSFGLDRSNDYLFELGYLGRSEESGIFSQQFIITEGAFKSVLPVRFANQFLVAGNSSIGLWRWFELYNDVAFVKNRNSSVFFAYENGIRFNFVHQIFEIYFPIYSNNGWEIAQKSYDEKIRFTFKGNFSSIINFFKRGFL